MLLTPQQRTAVSRDDRSSYVAACPGSGKTRTIVAKLLRCIDGVRDTPRRVACITYTNTGVYEIESRLRRLVSAEDEFYYSVSTIHAFCICHVLRHFYWRIPAYRNGFEVAAPESVVYEEALVAACDAHGVHLNAKRREAFELVNRAPNGDPIVPEGGPVSSAMVRDFWNYLESKGCLDFTNIVYATYRILAAHPTITEAIACRFAWMLLDEFQDTSSLQVEILRMIAARGRTRFFLVGDPLQSIFGFAGARPDLAETFAADIHAHVDAPLAINFRSSDQIVNHADTLCPRTPTMQAGGRNANVAIVPRHINAPTVFIAITEHFLPAIDEAGIPYGHAAILAPWWVPLLHLGRELREFGVPVIGPGARPYKRDRLFARVAEHVCAYIERRDPKIIPRIERAVGELVSNVTGDEATGISNYAGRVTLFRLIHAGERLRDVSPSGIQWLEAAATAFSDILIADGLLPRSASPLLPASVREMRDDMVGHDVDIANLSVADLGLFAAPEASIELMTMHKAKGREFSAVAIIKLHEGLVPRRGGSVQQVAEFRRLFYVGITRAEKLLMYVTDREDARNTPSQFLGSGGLALPVERV
jgi:DNA helicase-2/ATP-dependent DNA helicase PcrA